MTAVYAESIDAKGLSIINGGGSESEMKWFKSVLKVFKAEAGIILLSCKRLCVIINQKFVG